MGERTRIAPVACHVCRVDTLEADGYCGEGCRGVARQANEMLAKGLVTSNRYPDPTDPPQFPEPDA